MNNQFENSQCVISYRLLKLLQWLVEHEQEGLKALVVKSIYAGVDLISEKAVSHERELEDELQQSVVDYFSLLEILVSEVIDEDDLRQTIQRQLVPALDRIDNSFCDSETVASTVEKVVSKPVVYSKEVMKQVVFKELLKRWKPIKKSFAH